MDLSLSLISGDGSRCYTGHQFPIVIDIDGTAPYDTDSSIAPDLTTERYLETRFPSIPSRTHMLYRSRISCGVSVRRVEQFTFPKRLPGLVLFTSVSSPPLCFSWLLELDLQTNICTHRCLELTFGFPRLCRNFKLSFGVVSKTCTSEMAEQSNTDQVHAPWAGVASMLSKLREPVICDERICGPKIGL